MKIDKKDGTLYLIPETDLVASHIEKIRDFFINHLRENQDADYVILDAKGIEIVDSLGVNLIIGLYKQVISESKEFQIINAGYKFMKVTNFFHFSSLFNVSEA
ncbi:Anti-sigma-factor antagonist [Candidatus Magnetomoraceae bacterium gMMP-15]